MGQEILRIPQMGEGLTEARIVGFLKQPGEKVKRDEPVFEMETDKAILAVESPVDGILEEWQCKEGDILPIGAVVGSLQTDSEGAINDQSSSVQSVKSTFAEQEHMEPIVISAPSTTDGLIRNQHLSPRARKQLKDAGKSVEEIKLMPSDVHGKRFDAGESSEWLKARKPVPAETLGYQDIQLSLQQKTVAFKLSRASHLAVPATIEMELSWNAVESRRSDYKQKFSVKNKPSALDIIAWSSVLAMQKHSKFRSSIISDDIVREYLHVNLGIAVAMPNDNLTMAVVEKADALNFDTFMLAIDNAVRYAKDGKESRAPVQMSITNMAPYGLLSAVPVVAPPVMSTLFIGSPYDVPLKKENAVEWERRARLVLTFDHRLINGVGSARFLHDIIRAIEGDMLWSK